MKRSSSFWVSFTHAHAGIYQVMAIEPNMRRHFWLCQLLLWIELCLRPLDAIVVLTLFMAAVVFAAELINTAVENVANAAVGTTFHPLVKIAKDAAAGAVLILAYGSLSVAVLMLASTYPWRFRLFTRVHLVGAVLCLVTMLVLWFYQFTAWRYRIGRHRKG